MFLSSKRKDTAMTDMELRNTIIAHFAANPGVAPHWTTLGTDYEQGHRVLTELFAEGVIEWRKVPSKSGKTMQTKIFLRG